MKPSKLFEMVSSLLEQDVFGKVAELMIQQLGKFEDSSDISFDLYDPVQKEKIEVKFSTVMKGNPKKISIKNAISEIINATNIESRALSFQDISTCKFNCNIQQVKPSVFDVLYYGTFFNDIIYIFRIPSPQIIQSNINYSTKQHRGNTGEGQFHITNDNFHYHLEHFFVRKLTYEELYQILSDTKEA